MDLRKLKYLVSMGYFVSVKAWLTFVDKECKLKEANNFSKIPKLTLKVVKTSPYYHVWLCCIVDRYVNIV